MGRAGWFGMAFAAAALLFAAVPARAETKRIAVIDVNRVLNESSAGKVAKEKMQARYDELKKKLETMQDEAKRMKEELDKQKILLGKEKLKEKEDALAAKVAELRQLTQESEKEMQARQGELTREVLKQIEGILEKFVAEEKIHLVLERSGGVVHFDPDLDITSKILERLDKETSGGK